jgi:hypothetical protein
MTGARGDAYSAELTTELYEGARVVRVWRSGEGADGFGAMYQLFKPDPYIGKRVRFSAALRTVAVSGRAALCLRIDGPRTSPPAYRQLAFDNMYDRPPIVGTTEWSRHSLVADVAPEASAIFISNILDGTGELFWADIRFEVVDDSVPTTAGSAIHDAPQNLDFAETR